MAKLIGVKTVGDAIEYAGVTFEKTEGDARLGDIIVTDTNTYMDVKKGAYYLVSSEKGKFVGFEDDGGDERGIGDNSNVEFEHDVYSSSLTIYRRVESTLTTAQLIEQKRSQVTTLSSEIAELEAKQAEESTLSVGDYAKVGAEIVRVVLDDKSEQPYRVVSALSDDDDSEVSGWFAPCEIVKITPAEARAALITQVEALFSESV